MNEVPHITVWNNCSDFLKSVLPPQVFNTWISPIVPVKLVESTLTIEVPSNFFIEYLEGKLLDYLRKALKRFIGNNAKLIYVIKVTKEESVTYPSEDNRSVTNREVPYPTRNGNEINPFVIPGLRQLKIDPQLNPKYTFANFIEGECNKLARIAGVTISQSPGNNTFNPFFIYGGPGLGKTHLAQAIGIAIKEKFPEKIVLYVGANRFMTQFIDAVNVKNKMTDFLHFYQLMDVLILDDVHEFVKKEKTQNAFFHIFNHLHQSGKQLILTSDRPPVEMVGLEQRLLSRFKWGLSAELTAPSYETRLAILKSKSFKDGIELPDDVLEYMASNITGNIRELEGSLISLIAHATLTKERITLDLAKRVIEKIVTPGAQEISLDKIQDTVCDYFGINSDALLSKTRRREIVQARQITMYLGRNLTNTSLASIGKRIGNKDHATVLHACNTVTNLIETDRNFKQYVTDIKRVLETV